MQVSVIKALGTIMVTSVTVLTNTVIQIGEAVLNTSLDTSNWSSSKLYVIVLFVVYLECALEVGSRICGGLWELLRKGR